MSKIPKEIKLDYKTCLNAWIAIEHVLDAFTDDLSEADYNSLLNLQNALNAKIDAIQARVEYVPKNKNK